MEDTGRAQNLAIVFGSSNLCLGTELKETETESESQSKTSRDKYCYILFAYKLLDNIQSIA